MVIMVSGRAGEGKSTFCNICIETLEELAIPTEVFPFARGVKDSASFMGWDGRKDDRGRRLLQVIGGAGREWNESIWANKTVDSIKNWLGTYGGESWFAFIDDWRFENEGNVVMDAFHPVLKVRMVRPEKYHTLLGTPLYDDPSEIGLPSIDSQGYYDVLIHNEKMDDLINTTKQFVERTFLGG